MTTPSVRSPRPSRVPFSYLRQQFADPDPFLRAVGDVVRSGEFTLGSTVAEFERRFARAVGMPHAVGVGTGTDALSISLRLLGVGPGDEVITTPMTFVATVGAIVATGARPVFVDSDERYLLRPGALEAAITPRSKAVVPVHYGGDMADMPAIQEVAERHGLAVVEDACQAIGARLGGHHPGAWGAAAAYSLHPLKNLNVWGDGGVIVMQDPGLAERARRYRNHGLVDRDHVASWGINCRLDAVQAAVGNVLVDGLEEVTRARIANARAYDEALSKLGPNVEVPPRRPDVRHVFHLYMVRAERRDELLRHLRERGIDARVHYPVPLHLQPAAASLGHGPGDFPACERDCARILTLPVHQHLRPDDLAYVVDAVQEFYRAF